MLFQLVSLLLIISRETRPVSAEVEGWLPEPPNLRLDGRAASPVQPAHHVLLVAGLDMAGELGPGR